MAVEIKISGVSYRGVNDYQVRQQAGAISTSQVTVEIGDNPRPRTLQSIQILIDSVVVFSGIINQCDFPEYSTGYENRECKISAQSLEVVLAWRLVTHNFYNKYVHEIVAEIFTDYIAAEGITLGSISTTTLRIDSYKKTSESIQSILSDLASRLHGASFYISPDKKFYFLVAEDLATVEAPTHLSGMQLSEGIGSLRTIQEIKGSASTIVGSATNSVLEASIAALAGTTGRIEQSESDSTIHNDTKAAVRAQALLDEYGERELTLKCLCHDLTKSALYSAWVIAAGLYPSATLYPADNLYPSDSSTPEGYEGTYVVTERTIMHLDGALYSVAVTLKNRNFFARYGFKLQGIKQTLISSVASITDMAADGKFTPIEKIAKKATWLAIVQELPVYDAQATTYGLTTQKATYDAAFQALADYLNGGTTWTTGLPFWLSNDELSVTEDIVGDDFISAWNTYNTAKTALLAAIVTAAQAAATAAAVSTVPVYKGRIAYSAMTTTSGNENDIILMFSATTFECGIYIRHSGDWGTKLASPTSTQIKDAWYDILWANSNGFPSTGTAKEKVQAFTGDGLTFVELLGANTLLADMIKAISGFFENITVTGKATLSELVMSNVTPGTNVAKSYDALIAWSDSDFSERKILQFAAGGHVNITWSTWGYGNSSQVYINGTGIGSLHGHPESGQWDTFTENNIAVNAGDFISIYAGNEGYGGTYKIQNFRILINQQPGILPYLGI